MNTLDEKNFHWYFFLINVDYILITIFINCNFSYIFVSQLFTNQHNIWHSFLCITTLFSLTLSWWITHYKFYKFEPVRYIIMHVILKKHFFKIFRKFKSIYFKISKKSRRNVFWVLVMDIEPLRNNSMDFITINTPMQRVNTPFCCFK